MLNNRDKEMGNVFKEYIDHDWKPSRAICFVNRLLKDVKPSLNGGILESRFVCKLVIQLK